MSEQKDVAAMEAWVVAVIRRLQAESNLMDGSAERWRAFLTTLYQFRHPEKVDDILFDGRMHMQSVPGDDWAFTWNELVDRVTTTAYDIVLHHRGQLEQPLMGELRYWATQRFFYLLRIVSNRTPKQAMEWTVDCMNLGVAGERLGLWTSEAYVLPPPAL